MKYSDSSEFLDALEKWLKKLAEKSGRNQDYATLIRHALSASGCGSARQ